MNQSTEGDSSPPYAREAPVRRGEGSGQDEMVDLEDIYWELYGLPPGDFTLARDVWVRGARKAGNRELAVTVGQLRRPTAAAWMANQLARRCKDELGALLELGSAMRHAQDAADGPELRRLSQRRRQMMTALASKAMELARTQNQPISEGSLRELETTLEAGVADVGAAEALRSGCLTIGLTYSGFGSLDPRPPGVTEKPRIAVGRSETETQSNGKATKGKAQLPARHERSEAAGSQRGRPASPEQRAEPSAALEEAERMMKSAEDALKATHEEVSGARAERNQCKERLVEAERGLRETKGELQHAERRLTEVTQRERQAKTEAARATKRRDEAERLLQKVVSGEA